jgi:hypothetical protein
MSFDIKKLRSRGYRREHATEQIVMRNKAKKIVFRLKHRFRVKCYDLWSVWRFRMVLLTYLGRFDML